MNNCKMVSRFITRYSAFAFQLAALAGISFGQCRFPSSGTNRLLTYHFDPELSQTATVLHIILEFQGNAQGVEKIDLPSHWDGQPIRARSVHTTISDGPTSESRIVHFPANGPVVLTYDLFKDWNGPFQAPLQFHPVVMPEYFEINGGNGLVHPTLTGESLVTVNFDWEKIPPRLGSSDKLR